MKRNSENVMEFFRLEERVLFEAAAAAEIADAQANDPNADMNPAEQQAQDEKAASKNAPPETPSGAMTASDGAAQPDKVADVDAEIQALIDGEVATPAAGTEAVDDMINDIFNDYGADAVEEAIHDAFADGDQDDSMMDALPDITVTPEQELVIINDTVQDIDKIINSLSPNQEYLILNSDKNAMEQINDYLDASGKTYSAIHILSHGNAGYITLAGERYDASNFDAAEWAAIGRHLTADGDILFYGCNLAENQAGRDFIDMVAEAADADVAGSTDSTGINGNWELEYSHGIIDTLSISVDGYDGTLTAASNFTEFASAIGSGASSIEVIGDFAFEYTITINHDVTIIGTGDRYVLSAGNTTRMFIIAGGDVTFNNLSFDGEAKAQIMSISAGAEVSLNNITMQNGYAFNGGAIFNNGILNITNALFDGNASNGGGGAIYTSANSSSLLSLTDVTFTNNHAEDGGAIYHVDGSMSLDGAIVFEGNTCTGYGGAMYFGVNATVTIESTAQLSFISNEAGEYGGAIVNFTILSINNAEFTGNKAGIDGGAIYNSRVLSVSNSTFDNNTASSGNGGAIYTKTGLTVTESSFSNNTAAWNGGAIYAAVELNVADSIFEDNHVWNNVNSATPVKGGAIYAIGNLAVTGSTFTGNYAGQDAISGLGGAICFTSSAAINSSTFDGNHATCGGAIASSEAGNISLTIMDCTFTGNYTEVENDYDAVDAHGGAIYLVTGASAILTIGGTSKFTGNHTHKDSYFDRAGGAIYMGGNQNGAVLTLNINGTTDFANNEANRSGAISVGTVDYAATNAAIITTNVNVGTEAGSKVTFSGNKALWGGGTGGAISTSDTRGTVNLFIDTGAGSTVTFTDNSADYGGAIGSWNAFTGDKVNLTVGGGTSFISNKALIHGGAIDARGQSGTVVTIGETNPANGLVIFRGNSAASYGGAISSNGKVTVYNSEFTGNKASVGGAISLHSADVWLQVSNSTFKSNSAPAGLGGAIEVRSAREVKISGSSFEDNSANGGGALYANHASSNYTVEISDTTFSANKAVAGYGGAIYALGQGITWTLNNISFTSNTASYGGGAIFFCGSNQTNTALNITNSVFDGNTAQGDGGAIWSWNSNVISGTNFYRNTTTGRGGAICCTNGRLNITGGNFSENSATTGGAIHLVNTYTANSTISGTAFQNNTASADGGAIWLGSKDNLTLTNTTLSTNKAVNGGAIYSNGRLTINNGGTISGNIASADGGALYLAEGSAFTSSGSLQFNSNSAGVNGGAIYSRIDLSVSAKFTGNSAKQNGGAIYGENSVSVTDSTFTGNSAVQRGGAIYGKGTVNITRGIFTTNSAGSNGGAIYAASDLMVTHSEFRRNSANGDGGAVYAIGSSLTMDNTLIADNTAKGNGGGTYATAAVSLLNLTVANNTATGNGGGMWNSIGATVKNSIFWGNRGAAMNQLNTGVTNAVTYSGIENWTLGGTGNVNLQSANAGARGSKFNDNAKGKYYVCFVDEANGDYHLDSGSYAINRGSNVPMPETDLDGKTRIYNYANGGRIDMGAYESTLKGNVVLDAEGTDIVYGDTETLNAEQDGYGNGSFTFSGGSEYLDINGDQATAKKAGGKLTIDVDYSGDENWNESSTTIEINTLKRDITFTAEDARYTYDGTTHKFSWDGNAGGRGFAFDDSLISYDSNSYRNAGEYIDALFNALISSLTRGDMTANYNISYKDGTMIIDKATIVVNRNGEDKVYDGTTDADYTWSLDGLIAGDDVDYNKGNAHFDNKNAGKNKTVYFDGDSLSGSDLDNYEIVYNDKGADIFKATIVVNRDGEDKVYDGTTDADYTWSLDGLIAGDDVDYNKGNAQFSDKNVGKNKTIYFSGDSLSGSDLDNYEVVYNDKGADIFKATIVVNRDGENKVYDGTTDADYTWSIDGLIDGDDVDYNKGEARFDNKNAGKDKDVYFDGDSLSGDDADNYEIVYNDKGADIFKATIIINRDGEDKVYDGTTNADYTWSIDGLIAGDDVNYNKGEARFDNKNAGKNKTIYFDGDSLSGSDLDNYEIIYDDKGADIFKATIVVNRNGEDKVYDGTTNADYTWSIDGLIAGDDVDYNKGEARFDNKNAGKNKTVYFDGDSLNGSDADNYEIVYNDKGADIFKATIVINRDGEDKVYDGTTNADYTWSLDGLIAGDDVDYNKGNAHFDNKNAGKNKNVYFGGDSLSGSDLDNYEIVYDDKGADINKASLLIVIDDKSKMTGENDPAFTGHTEGLVDGDSVFGYDRSNKGEAAGKYAIDEYQIDDGNDGNNYDITVIDGTLTIIGTETGDAPTNIYKDASSRNYIVNGMDQASLMNKVSTIAANRETDSVVDDDTDGNANNSSHQTADKAGDKPKTNLKETSQKKTFEKRDLQMIQQRTNTLLTKSGPFGDSIATSNIVELQSGTDGERSNNTRIMVPGSKSVGGFRFVVPASDLNLNFTNESTHPMNHMPSQIDVGGSLDVVNFSGVELTDAVWTEKTENLKDRLDLLLEEMMAV